MSSPPPAVSVVILSWNTRELLQECLAALRQGNGGLPLEPIVIDNASSDGSAELVARQFPEVRLVRNGTNLGYAAGVNQGLRLATAPKICLLGSDTRVAPDALPKLAAFLEAHPEAGAVAPRLVNPDGTVQHACMRFPTLRTVLYWDTPLQAWFPNAGELVRYQMRDWDHRGTREVEQPPGTCFMIRRDAADRIGPMDEQLWLFFNDVDWALRLRRSGYAIWYVDDAVVVHHLGGSTRHFADFAAEWHRNRIRFYRKHHHVLGAALAKGAAVWVALRQCWRIRRDVGLGGREYFRNARLILRTLAGVLRV